MTFMRQQVSQWQSIYICGSQYEGTTTPGMYSDMDFLFVHENYPVVVDTSSALQHKHCLLMVQDSQTPPGYAKLQVVDYGLPMYLDPLLPSCGHISVDREGRGVLDISELLDNSGQNRERHGPATTFTIPWSGFTADNVIAMRCRRWPHCAIEWLTRQRRYNWPDSVLFNKCKSLDCFFVQVGHSTSPEKNLHWRLSFSLQERLLVTNFNSTQLKCYILMKLMKKEILPRFLQEATITSYHCKTCMLYMIENTPASFWIEENLLICFYSCVKMILMWSENGVCPNYFIPDENMFDGKMSKPLRVKVCSVLQMIISSDFKFLLGLKSNNFGTRLENVCTTPNIRTGYEETANEVISSAELYMVLVPFYTIKWRIALSICNPLTLIRILALKHQLLQTESITEHTRGETQRAISFLLPYIDLALVSELIVSAKHRQKPVAVIYDALMSDKWRDISSQSDQFSARLKQANYLCLLGYYMDSLDILVSLDDKINPNVKSKCVCVVPAPSYKPPMTTAEVHSVEDLLRHHLIPCVEFLQSEKDLTPTALCYEMISLPGGTTELDIRIRSIKTDTAVVDGKILLYFLMYLNHRALDMECRQELTLKTSNVFYKQIQT